MALESSDKNNRKKTIEMDFKYDVILNDIRFEADTILGLRIFTID